MNNVAAIARPEFSPEFANWFATASIGALEEAYAESYKEAHGIKARWVYGSGHTREELADMFVRLGHDIQAERERERQADAAFMARVESLGLTGWAEANGIKSELDLWEYNYAREYTPDPAPLPYEGMAARM